MTIAHQLQKYNVCESRSTPYRPINSKYLYRKVSIMMTVNEDLSDYSSEELLLLNILGGNHIANAVDDELDRRAHNGICECAQESLYSLLRNHNSNIALMS